MHTHSTDKHVYVVLGMARSGTSAITRGLKALGIDLGTHLMPAEKAFNPKGVYEDIDVAYKINRAVSYALGYTWESLQVFDEQCRDSAPLNSLKKEAVTILQHRFSATDHWAFKDPRTCKLLPFWQTAFQALHLKEHYVIALRHPLASSYSWHNLNEVDVEAALLSWLTHTISAVEGTQNKQRIVVSYDLMLQAPLQQLERIRDRLNIKLPSHPDELNAYANDFLDKKLKHHDYHNETAKHPVLSIAPVCLKVYELLMQAAKDDILLDSDHFANAWQAVTVEFNAVYPVYCYVDALIKRNKEQERHIRTIHKSLPWKMIYPIRLVDNALRAFRNKRKDRQRHSLPIC